MVLSILLLYQSSSLFFIQLCNICYSTLQTIYTSLNMIFEQRKRENTIMRHIGLSKKNMILMYIKESVFWAIFSGAIMFGIVSYKSIHDYLVNIKYLGDGYKMIFSFETVSLATLYVSVLFVLVFIVVLKKRIEE